MQDFGLFLVVLFVGIIFFLKPSKRRRGKQSTKHRRRVSQEGSSNRADGHSRVSHASKHSPRIIKGKAFIIDGDSLIIAKRELRLFGVDAPEFNHPWGKKAKWELVSLCKGQVIEATIVSTDHFDRTVAICRLPDGRDLSEEMVKSGLALDWPKFSGGVYRQFEPQGVRKKLWLADARQKGRMHVWDAYDARQKQG